MTMKGKFVIIFIIGLEKLSLSTQRFDAPAYSVFISSDICVHNSFYKLTNWCSFLLLRKALDRMVETRGLKSCPFEVAFILNQSSVEPCLSSSASSLSSLLVLYSALRGFSPGTPVFPSPQKRKFD